MAAAASRGGLLRAFRVLMVADLLVKALALISVVIVARVVGPSALGALSAALALISYAAVLSDGGLSLLTTRQILQRPQDGARLASTTALAQLLVAAVLTTLLGALVLSNLLSGNVGRLLLALLPMLLVQALSLVYVLQSYDRMVAVAKMRVVTQVIASAVGVGGVLLTEDVVWVAVATWLGALVTDCVVAVLLFRQGLRAQRVRFAQVLRTLWDGKSLLAISIVTQWVANIDIIVLAALTTEFAVGLYGAAYRLVFTALSLVAVVVTAIFPQLVRRWNDDRMRFGSLLERVINSCSRVTLLAWACVIVSAPLVVDVVYGEAFSAAAMPLAVLFAWVPLGFYNSLLGQALVAAEMVGTYLRITLVTAVVVLVGLLSLIPAFGPTGAAAAVASAEVITAIGFTAVAHRLGVRGLRAFASGFPYLVAPLTAGVVAQMLSASHFIGLTATLVTGALLEVANRGSTLSGLRAVRGPADVSSGCCDILGSTPTSAGDGGTNKS